ncbi:MAG: hypothetical protein HY342_01025 [Candidatus Lambdaproteobacteria bacterium]|nr:hypothetical protein [Candidatus Lambdaproteobacteria bacterium]
MRLRTPISLFPFLSVLLGTMGVVSFLAVTFLMFSENEQRPAAAVRPVEVRWVGAPPHVQPLLVECRAEGALVHFVSGRPERFELGALRREVERIKTLQAQAIQALGPAVDRQRLWIFMKSTIPADESLSDSLSMALHGLEMSNIDGSNRARRVEQYPILLVYPQGIEAYDLVAYLLETTTRLSVGLEPMLDGWQLPYRAPAS